MANQQPEQPEQQTYWRQWLKNRILRRPGMQRVSRWFQRFQGIPLRFARYRGQKLLDIEPVREELGHKQGRTDTGETITTDMMILMRTRSSAVNTIESSWTDFDSYDPETGRKGLLQKLEDVYQKAGIYIDQPISNWEYPLYERGIRKEDLTITEDIEEDLPDDTTQLTGMTFLYDEFSIQIGNSLHTYPVPAKTKVRYPIAGMTREWVVEISPFGYRRLSTYQELYDKIIRKICNDYKEYATASDKIYDNDPVKNEQIKNNIRGWVGSIANSYANHIGLLLADYCLGGDQSSSVFKANIGVEKKARSFVRARGVQIKAEKKPTVDILNNLRDKRFTEDLMHYHNNYQIIQPVVYGKRYYSGQIVDELKKYNKYRNPGGGEWHKKDDEVDHGLDRYGFPLEIDENGYVMIDKKDDNGNPTPKNTWRQVPGGKNSKFKRDIDALEMANYITNMHDTYRDDLRDGRFHTGTSTIMDYVEANNRSSFNPPLWEMEDENEIQNRRDIFTDEVTGQKYVPIDFTRPVMGINRVLYKVGPSDRNPAFDLRAINKRTVTWKHIGRKYYYEVPDHVFQIMDRRKEPHISSRGVSMYIIEKLMRKIRPWDDVVSELNTIGGFKEGAGFDFGVRPWDMWGKSMQVNVFEWRGMLKRVNTIIKPKHSVDEYINMWGKESQYWH